MTAPNDIAADLRISWRPFVEPLRSTYIGMDGKPYEHVIRGVLRAEWDSPEGLFSYLFSSADDPGEHNYDDLRPLLAADLLDAYERAKREEQ